MGRRARLEGKLGRKNLVGTLAARDCRSYATLTGLMTRMVLGRTPGQIRAARALKKHELVRGHLSTLQLTVLALAEVTAAHLMWAYEASGEEECTDCCRRAAELVGDFYATLRHTLSTARRPTGSSPGAMPALPTNNSPISVVTQPAMQ